MKNTRFSSKTTTKKKVWVAPTLEHIEIKSKNLGRINYLAGLAS